MNLKEFQKLLARDQVCQHCGIANETLVPNHRISRGMGGSKKLNNPSNLVLICSSFNGLIESSAPHAEFARKMGIKLNSWENPLEVPVYFGGQYWLLDDTWGRTVLPNYEEH